MALQTTGQKIRSLRLGRGMTQQQLADQCGLTKSLISKIEHGQTGSAVATLSKLANALGVTLSWLLQEEDAKPLSITRVSERQEIQAGEEAGYLYQTLAVSSSNTKIQPTFVRVLPGNRDLVPYTHSEHEFVYVLQGEIDLSYDGELTRLREGDTAYFDGSRPHVFLPTEDDKEANVLSIFISN
ncbi:helix-turn-helix domain-containing protein [Bhargavaea ginsengi]|uniref:helix-turn-helix domain-containing protein n=1 Tax=Bhargavaea ginsengi TaxID=426757 RepID=UPI003C712260